MFRGLCQMLNSLFILFFGRCSLVGISWELILWRISLALRDFYVIKIFNCRSQECPSMFVFNPSMMMVILMVIMTRMATLIPIDRVDGHQSSLSIAKIPSQTQRTRRRRI